MRQYVNATVLNISINTRNHTQSHTIPHNPTQSHTIPHNPTQIPHKSHTIPHNPTQSHTIPHNPTQSHTIHNKIEKYFNN